MRSGQFLSAVLAGGAVAIFVAFLGVELAFSAAWGITVGAVTFVAIGLATLERPHWPPTRTPEQETRGSEVARLAWSFDVRTGVAGFAVKRRLRMLAERRLADRGLTLGSEDEAAVRALLGGAATVALTADAVTRDDITATLDALDALGAPHQEEP